MMFRRQVNNKIKVKQFNSESKMYFSVDVHTQTLKGIWNTIKVVFGIAVTQPYIVFKLYAPLHLALHSKSQYGCLFIEYI